MATIKITQLAPGTSLSGAELFESVQAGTSVRLSAAQLAQYVESQILGGILPVAKGGTGSASITGYAFGSGIAPLGGVTSIPYTDISGLGTAAQINIHVGTTAPSSPAVGDLWVDTN